MLADLVPSSRPHSLLCPPEPVSLPQVPHVPQTPISKGLLDTNAWIFPDNLKLNNPKKEFSPFSPLSDVLPFSSAHLS